MRSTKARFKLMLALGAAILVGASLLLVLSSAEGLVLNASGSVFAVGPIPLSQGPAGQLALTQTSTPAAKVFLPIILLDRATPTPTPTNTPTPTPTNTATPVSAWKTGAVARDFSTKEGIKGVGIKFWYYGETGWRQYAWARTGPDGKVEWNPTEDWWAQGPWDLQLRVSEPSPGCIPISATSNCGGENCAGYNCYDDRLYFWDKSVVGWTCTENYFDFFCPTSTPTPTSTSTPTPTPTSTPTRIPGIDEYEPDDTYEDAKPIAIVTPPIPLLSEGAQRHNLHPGGDKDLVRFPAKAGYWYDVRTFGLALGVDTVMTVTVGADVYFNDDLSETNPASRVTFSTTVDATAVVTITDFAGQGGADHTYWITVEQLVDKYEPDDTDDTASPISHGHDHKQTHNFYPDGDVDKVWFGVKEGLLYALGTSNLISGTDTVISVEVNGAVCDETDYYWCENDDIYTGLPDPEWILDPEFFASEVRFVPDEDGYAVATVSKGLSGFYGHDKTYDLELTLLSVHVDKYEPDEIRPKIIDDREPQGHNFCPDDDEDFVKWPVKEGRLYGVFTSGLAFSVDTKLKVTMDDPRLGKWEWECDDYDPGSGNFASSLCFRAPFTPSFDEWPVVAITNLYEFGPYQEYTITVVEEPFIEAEPESLSFEWAPYFPPPFPPPQTISVTVPGGGNLLWSLEADADWLFASFSEGKTPSEVTVWADDYEGFPDGLYEATITITVRSSNPLPLGGCFTYCDEEIQPLTVPVRLVVRPVLATPTVTPTPTDTPTPTSTPTNTATATPTPTSTPTPTPCVDGYEPDDTWQYAKWIVVNGAPQSHNFHTTYDRDYVKFVAEAGRVHTIRTFNLSDDNDTRLILYDTDGTTELIRSTFDPDNPRASKIVWLCPTRGAYFVEASPVSPQIGGCDTTYELEVTSALATPTPTPCWDGYEPDDTWQQSKLIEVGESQDHRFHTAGDEDWVKFVAQPLTYTTYTIWTREALGWDVDTTITLYNTDGTSELLGGYNDDDLANPPFSKITYGFPVTGTYFAKVKHFNPSAGGCEPEFWYTLEITQTSLSSLMPERVAHLAPRLQTMYERTDVFLPVFRKEWE